ncbi:hypothetical protein COV17_00785 [Candidatus Woesearchaeota archaeon CG10_big_fil_rev_8_21_14_0_10_36_11]|nr:MAG: hypothetical protein COV17_00785 [Candidatus Woesearchaeota archaeon CG10_big_fil_rev_8_21_14_0_10_36_11]
MARKDEPDLVTIFLNEAGKYDLLTKEREVDLARKIEEPRIIVDGIATMLTLWYPSAFPAPLHELYKSLQRKQRENGEETTYHALEKLVLVHETLRQEVKKDNRYSPKVIFPDDSLTLKEQVYALDEKDLMTDFPDEEVWDVATYTALLTRYVSFDDEKKEQFFREETVRLALDVLTRFEDEKELKGIGKHRTVGGRKVLAREYMPEVRRLATLAGYIYDFEDAERGSEDAKEMFVNSNIRLVGSIARKYLNRGLDFSDLIQEGNIGLMKAVERFDYRLGFKFSGYATYWIKQAITRGLYDQKGTVRIPIHANEEMRRLTKFVERFLVDHDREPTDEDIVGDADISPAALKRLREAVQGTISSDDRMSENEDDNRTYGDQKEDETGETPYTTLEASIRVRAFREAVSGLSDARERKVLTMLHCSMPPYTQQEVADHFRVTSTMVQHINKRALRRIIPGLAKRLDLTPVAY